MMKQILPLVLIAIAISSCTSEHYVLLRSNGTVEIETARGLDGSFYRRLATSVAVSHVDTSRYGGYEVHFDLNSVDSLGNFLPFQNPGFLVFDDYGDSIVMQRGGVAPYDSKPGMCCHLNLRIRADYPIEAFRANGKRIRAKRSKKYHGIWFWLPIREQVKGNKKIYAVIKRKN